MAKALASVNATSKILKYQVPGSLHSGMGLSPVETSEQPQVRSNISQKSNFENAFFSSELYSVIYL